MCYGGLTNKGSSLFFQFGYLDEESAEQQISFGETEEERQKIASKIQSDRDSLKGNIDKVLQTITQLLDKLSGIDMLDKK